MDKMVFSDANLFEACAFANKGLVCKKLSLRNIILIKSRFFETNEGILDKILGSKAPNPNYFQDVQEVSFFKAIVTPVLQLELVGLTSYALLPKHDSFGKPTGCILKSVL